MTPGMRRVVVAPGEQSRAGGRAERRSVELRVAQPALRQLLQRRRLYGAAERARSAKADVIQKHDHDVGCAFGGLHRRWKIGLRFFGAQSNLPFEGRRWGGQHFLRDVTPLNSVPAASTNPTAVQEPALWTVARIAFMLCVRMSIPVCSQQRLARGAAFFWKEARRQNYKSTAGNSEFQMSRTADERSSAFDPKLAFRSGPMPSIVPREFFRIAGEVATALICIKKTIE